MQHVISLKDPEELKGAIRTLREACLLLDTDGLSVEAEPYFWLAFGALDQAQRFAELLNLKQTQARAAAQGHR